MFKALTLRQYVPAPSAPAVADQGTTGATARSYKIVALDADGNHSAASTAGSSATGNATLSVLNFERITWTDSVGAVEIQIWRTVPSGSKGLIGTVAAGVQTFDDTGLALVTAGDPPTTNTTGVGDPVDVADLSGVCWQLSGTFSATLQLQGEISPGAWVSEGAALTGVAVTSVTKSYRQLRVTQTAYTSGTPVVGIVGQRHF